MSFNSLILLLLIIVAIANAGNKVCPGYGFIRPPTNCSSTCSMENDQCPSDQKCCLRIEEPCGYHCIVPKEDNKKAGQCPSTSSEVDTPYWNLCDGHFCDVDNDCKGTEKCCSNPCGSTICLSPE